MNGRSSVVSIHILSMVLVSGISSCGMIKKSDDSNSGGPDPRFAVSTGAVQPEVSGSIIGTWAGPCTIGADKQSSAIEIFEISSLNEMKHILKIYSDSDCETPTLTLGLKSETKIVGNSKEKSDGIVVSAVTKEGAIIPEIKELKDLYNAQSKCGRTDWEVGKAIKFTPEQFQAENCTQVDEDQSPVLAILVNSGETLRVYMKGEETAFSETVFQRVKD